MAMVTGDGELFRLHTGFDIVLRGYRRGQVRRYVHCVEARLRLLISDKVAADTITGDLMQQVVDLRAANAELRATIGRIGRTPIEADGLADRLRHLLALATAEAADITARAAVDAERLRDRYESLVAEAAARLDAATAECDELLRRSHADADAILPAARAEAAATVRDAQALADRLVLDATARAHRLVRDATDRADRIVGDASRQVRALHQLRGRIVERLHCARHTLGEAAPLIHPDPTDSRR